MNEISDVAAIAVAVIALLGVFTGIIAWFYRRGGQERDITAALAENTKAAAENTKSNQELTSELRDFKGETLLTLRDHDWRIKLLEQAKDK